MSHMVYIASHAYAAYVARDMNNVAGMSHD